MAKNRKPVLRTANSQYIETEALNSLTFDFYQRCFKFWHNQIIIICALPREVGANLFAKRSQKPIGVQFLIIVVSFSRFIV